MKKEYNKFILKNALQDIREKYDKLRLSEKQVANYILRNSESVINCSVSEVSENCEVSEATVIRFCKSTGFQGFQDLKLSIAKNLTQSETSKISGNITAKDNLEVATQKVFSNNSFALNETFKILDKNKLQHAIDLLNKAQIIYIYGLGTSGIVADYAAYRLTRIGFVTKKYVDSHSIALSTAIIKPQDAIISISQSGSTKEIVEAVGRINDKEVKTVSITGYPTSPIAEKSDIILENAIHETPFESGAMPAMIAQLSVIDTIIAGCSIANFQKTTSVIKATAEALKDKKY